jgi:2-polyprenyl-3-methyl-5-hydroxy-6-metoxy-1,4-benzoquinol methylase
MREAKRVAAPAEGMHAMYRDYDKFKGWHRFFEFDAEAAAYYAGELGTRSLAGKTVLEIGFGSGGFLAWARDAGASVAGTEIQEEALAAAEARGIDLIDADVPSVAEHYAQAFDYIVAFDVLEHLPLADVPRLLEAMSIMLKPAGEVIVRFPNGQSPFGLVHQYGDATHLHPLSADIVGQLVDGTALTVVRSGAPYRVYGPRRIKWPVRWLRYRLQDLVEAVGKFIYPSGISYSPVITVVLRKRPATRG